jgi:hypothetical protein
LNNLADHRRAITETEPSLDELYREVYGRRLTAQQRLEIRQARSTKVRAEVEAEKRRQQDACTCKLCMAETRGKPPQAPHGEYAYKTLGCRCNTCRDARRANERFRRRHEAAV